MTKWVRTLNVGEAFFAAKEARLELEEAQLARLTAQTQMEYSRSMVGFQKARIKRLTKYLQEEV